ncbi:MAG: SDR family oxidoreductase [Coxiellaceae bacterium]|nr:SDR family oxidoreductase [Coxiellaceae bacterium]
MDLNLKDKVALVTGASQGVGYGIASVLGREGCDVIVNGRNESSLIKAANSIGRKTNYIVGDMCDEVMVDRTIQQVIDTHGRLDILVCNVGSGKSAPPGDETISDWQSVMDKNVLSAFHIIQRAKPHLIASEGCIICVSSICGNETVPGAPTVYTAAKAALNAYIKSLSRPLGKEGVRINAVVPGNIIFPNSTWHMKQKQNPEKVKAMLETDVPLGRFATPEEIGDLVAFLSSTKAGFITGGLYVADGGQTRSW